MRSIRKLALMGLAALMVCAAVASAASATQIKDMSGTLYSGTVNGTQVGSGTLTSSWAGTITCTSSSLSGSVTGSTASGSITSASWGGCTSSLGSCTVTATNLPWSSSVTGSGPFTWNVGTAIAVQIKCGFITCNYSANANTITGSVTNPSGGNPARVAFVGQTLVNSSCGGTGTWNATYDLKGVSGGTAIDIQAV